MSVWISNLRCFLELICNFFVQRHEVMKHLIQRYLLTFEKTAHQSPAPQRPAETDDSNHLRELITRLEGALKKTETDKAAKKVKEVSGQSWSFLFRFQRRIWLIFFFYDLWALALLQAVTIFFFIFIQEKSSVEIHGLRNGTLERQDEAMLWTWSQHWNF